MAIGDSYASATDLKNRIDDGETVDDAVYTQLLKAVSRGLEDIAHRQFNKETSATARMYYPMSRHLAYVDDFWTISGLVIKTDADGDGIYETTISSSDYTLEPLNGVVSGMTGWPYSRIRLHPSAWFPCSYGSPSLQVTAQWGWATIPDPIKQVCIDATTEMLKIKEVSFVPTVRLQQNPRFMDMLRPYVNMPVLVG